MGKATAQIKRVLKSDSPIVIAKRAQISELTG